MVTKQTILGPLGNLFWLLTKLLLSLISAVVWVLMVMAIIASLQSQMVGVPTHSSEKILSQGWIVLLYSSVIFSRTVYSHGSTNSPLLYFNDLILFERGGGLRFATLRYYLCMTAYIVFHLLILWSLAVYVIGYRGISYGELLTLGLVVSWAAMSIALPKNRPMTARPWLMLAWATVYSASIWFMRHIMLDTVSIGGSGEMQKWTVKLPTIDMEDE